MSKSRAQMSGINGKIDEYHRALLELLPSAAMVTGYDGVILYANEQVRTEFGFEVGKNIQDFYENIADRKDVIEAIRTKGFLDKFELPAHKADGTHVWILVSSRRFEFEGNQAILSSLVDITQRKQAEEALRVSEEKFRTIFMVSSDGIYLSKPEGHGKFIEVNEAFLAISGYTREELIGKSALDLGLFYDPADREKLLAEIQAHNFYKEMELKVRRKNGEVIDCIMTLQSIYLDNEMYVMGALRNITEHKRREEALQASEEKYRQIVDTASEGIWVTDENFLITFSNRRMGEILGYQIDEVIGHNSTDFMFEEDRLEHRKRIEKRQRGIAEIYERRFRHKNGQPIWTLVSGAPITKNESVFCGAIGMFTDITARKNVEVALEHSQANLSALIESTNDLIWSVDLDFRLVIFNKALEQHFLRNYRTFPFIGARPEDMIPSERAVRWPALYERALTTGAYRIEYELPDGRILELSFDPVNQSGKAVGVSVFGKDITSHKKAEENLAQQAERLAILHTVERAITSKLELKHILDLLANEMVKQIHVDACAILLLNLRTNRLEFSARKGFHTKALKFTRLALGVGLAGRAAQERKIVQISNLSQIVETGPSLVKAVEGENFVSYLGIPLIAKDQVLGVMEIFHRTELKPTPEWLKFLETLADQAAISIDNARLLETTQQNLKETNALYQINQDLIAATDAEFLMKNVVDLLQKNFGYYYVQIFVADPRTGNFVLRVGSGEIGKKLKSEGYFLAAGEGIIGFTAETGKPFFTNDVDQVISFVRMPHLLKAKSELAVPIKAGEHMIGLLDVHQCPPGLLTERDMQLVSIVADQLAVAHQKAQMYAELQSALKHEQTTRDALIQAEKLTLSGRLLASVSHELNNPIQAIQNALFLLKEEQGISSQGKQDLEIVLSETERMATLLERLRATYQPASQQEFRLAQINDLIADTCALVATHLRHSSISHVFLADPNLPPIPALANQLRQVFLNLIMNAADAMPKGGQLTLSTQLLPGAAEVLIKIADTGTGIDAVIYPNIFEAFVTNKERGTGLGLAISYEIILKHKGRIKAENNPDKGATISIWLPVSDGGEE